ncbi:MAG: hypothetical protein ACE5PV_21100 [Candidatus Poribacteria bacterium]
MRLSNKEELLVGRVIGKIKEIAPASIVKIQLDTIEGTDVDILVYTDKSAMDILRHTAGLTLEILANEGFHIGVLPIKRDMLTAA